MQEDPSWIDSISFQWRGDSYAQICRMVWIDYRAFGEFGPGSQYLFLWLGICCLFAIECSLAHLRHQNKNLVNGCHANGLHCDQFDRGVAMAVLACCGVAAVAYTF